jgi:hypothetical protein
MAQSLQGSMPAFFDKGSLSSTRTLGSLEAVLFEQSGRFRMGFLGCTLMMILSVFLPLGCSTTEPVGATAKTIISYPPLKLGLGFTH